MSVTAKLKQAFVASRVAHDYPEAESKFVEVEGHRIHFVVKGSGRPVVLIHGNPGSCQDWTTLYAPLTSRFCAFAFDRPGHGHRSEEHTSELQSRFGLSYAVFC